MISHLKTNWYSVSLWKLMCILTWMWLFISPPDAQRCHTLSTENILGFQNFSRLILFHGFWSRPRLQQHQLMWGTRCVGVFPVCLHRWFPWSPVLICIDLLWQERSASSLDHHQLWEVCCCPKSCECSRPDACRRFLTMQVTESKHSALTT